MTKIKKATLVGRIKAYNKDKFSTEIAYEVYTIHQKLVRRPCCNSIDDFIMMKSYTSFLKLAKFIPQVHILDVSIYLQAMRVNQRRPNTWTNNLSYRLYLEYMDDLYPPIDAISDTVTELFDMSQIIGMPVHELIVALSLSEIMILLRQRRLTPWILLHSPVVKGKIMSANDDTQKEFLSMFDMDTWTIKFSQNTPAVNLARKVVEELGL